MTIRFDPESMFKQIYEKVCIHKIKQAFYPLYFTLQNTISCTSAFF